MTQRWAAPSRYSAPSLNSGTRDMPYNEIPIGDAPPSMPHGRLSDMTSTGKDITKLNHMDPFKDIIAKWSPFFGPPPRPMAMAYQDLDEQHRTLPEAYEGDSIYLREVVITKVKEGDEWLYHLAAPLVNMEGSMSVKLDRMIYHDTTLDSLGEEGVARLMTSSKEVQGDQLRRYGGALLINSMHLQTPSGQTEYSNKIRQLINATHETIAMGVAHHLLNHQPYVDRNAKYNLLGNGSLDNEMRDKTHWWCKLCKSPDAAEDIIQKGDDVFDSRGVAPANLFIWPKGGERYCRNRPFYMTGKPFNENENYVLSQVSRNLIHKESRGFRVGNHDPVEDPHFRLRTIGGFFYFNNLNLTDVPQDKYKTCFLDRITFSEKDDGWKKIPYEKTKHFSGLYYHSDITEGDGKQGTLTPFGQEFFDHFKSDTWGEFIPKFLNKGQTGSSGKTEYMKIINKLYRDLNDEDRKKNGIREAFLDVLKKHEDNPNDKVSVNWKKSVSESKSASYNAEADADDLNDEVQQELGNGNGDSDIIKAGNKRASIQNQKKQQDDDDVPPPPENGIASTDHTYSLLRHACQNGNGDTTIERKWIENWLLHSASVVIDAFWSFQIEFDGYQWFGALCTRPYGTYVTGSGIMMSSGGECAITGIGHQKFRLGSDAARDLIFGQYTNYHKTMVLNNAKIYLFHDILPKSYEGGNGHDFWDPTDDFADVDDYKACNLTRDIFSCVVPINWSPPNFYLDLTGRHNIEMEGLGSDGNTCSSDTLHYPTAELYSSLWGWQTTPESSPLDSRFFSEMAHSPKFNTTCFQQHQWQFQWNGVASNGGGYTDFVSEKTHWGENVYEGCAKVRRGAEKYFKCPSYLQTKTLSLTY